MVPLSLVMEGNKTSEATKETKNASFYSHLTRSTCGRTEKNFWSMHWKAEKDEET